MPTEKHKIASHPILTVEEAENVEVVYNGSPMKLEKGMMLSSALISEGKDIFCYHPHDNHPQGIYCSNGQCAQCLMLVNGKAVKSCITPVAQGMQVESLQGLPLLKEKTGQSGFDKIEVKETDCLVVGGGPSGLNAAITAASMGFSVVVVDDKSSLGGKLVLQTHKFFGSIEDCYAGTRGIDIAKILTQQVEDSPLIQVMLNTQTVGIFGDHRVGVVCEDKYTLIQPKTLLVTTGAREKSLVFPGCDLPGIYGAGAFQTLVNRDLVQPADKMVIVGGGNVGLITAYHALQAGMTVIAVLEALPKVSGYKVHADKIERLGIPVLTCTTILQAQGKNQVESILTANLDKQFQIIPNTYKRVTCDTVLIATGLNPVNEFYQQAIEHNFKVFVAGDAEEIAEASAAMFNGKVKGMEIVKSLQQITSSGPESSDASTNPGVDSSEDLQRKADILKSRPGRIVQENYHEMVELKVYPVLHCLEEIPCNPCITVCKQESIQLENKLGDIRDLPFFQGECNGCARCVAICPGLAITMVDKRKAKPGKAHVVIPFELLPFFQEGDQLELCDTLGQKLGQGQVVKFRNKRWQDRTALVTVEVPLEIAPKVAGIAMQDKEEMLANFVPVEENQISQESPVVCRCERVRKEKVLEMKALGVQDMNHLKTIRCSMGACGGKTCIPLIKDIYAREGGEPCELIEPTLRPLNAEVTLSVFAGAREKKGTKLK